MNPIEKALKTADKVIAANAELERLSANPNITVLKTGRLSPDGSVTGFTVEATYNPNDRWSGGIAKVYVTKDEADRIVDHTSAAIPAGDEGSVYWEGENGESGVLAYVDYDGVTHVAPENGLYEVGFGWCWEEANGDDGYASLPPSRLQREADAQVSETLVFVIDVTTLTPEQRVAINAAVSAQLDDGTEDYPAAEYDSRVFASDEHDHHAFFGALEVGLGF